jgi:hypothetical protein
MKTVLGKLVENANGDLIESVFYDNYGNLVERPKHDYPYSYSPYVNWQHPKAELLEKQNAGFYTDRAFTWDHEKYNDLCQKHFGDHGQYWNNRAPSLIQLFVRDYNDDQSLILTKVIEYCNVSNGYPVWYLGYYSEKNND